MRPLLDRVRAGEVLVADGAMGTMLFERGLAPGRPPESVNVERPELLEEIARLYLAAGAEVVQTNTFGASPLKLALHGLDGSCEEINRSAVAAVKVVASGRAYVSASVGPTGRILRPYGDTEPKVVAAAYERQIRAIAGAGADLLCIETMTDLEEATLAIRAAKNVAPDLPVMATMTFDRTKRGFFTIMGVSVERAADGLARAGADVIGSNCGNGIDAMVEIARQLRRASPLPILVQPNAGLPEMREGRPVYSETPELMASRVATLVAAGVSIVGGCCGTTPAHIAAIRAAVSALARGPDRTTGRPPST